jgi:phage shock protein E
MIEKNKTTFIDVRTPDEFAMEHIDGAINIPLDKLQQNIPAVVAIQGPKILYCRSGGRSSMAVNLLKQHGIANVENGGGIDELVRNIG